MKITNYSLFILVAFLTALLPAAPLNASKPYITEERSDKSWNLFTRARKDNPVDELASARRRREAGRLISAGRRYRAVYNQWPVSREAAEALWEYAETLATRGRERKAFDTYQQLIEEHPGKFPYEEALERQFNIAVHMMTRRKSRILFGGFRDPEDAVPFLEKVVANGPAWEKAPRAQFLIAKAYELGRTMDKAAMSYLKFELSYPEHELAAEAAYRRCIILHRLAIKSPRNTLLLDETWTAMTNFLTVYSEPEGHAEIAELRAEIRTRRADTAFEEAVFYDRKARRPQAALTAYRSFLRSFPDSAHSGKARLRIQELEEKLSHETDAS